MLRYVIVGMTMTVAAGVTVAGCGGSSSSAGNPAAARAVQRALVATENRAYSESFSEDISLDTSGLPPAEASRLAAVGGTIVGTADVTNTKNFHVVVTLRGVKVYVRAVNGQLSVSQDGVNYQPAPAATAKEFSQLVSVGPGVAGHIENAGSLGTAQVSGQTVNRYTATIPGSALAPALSALNVKFGSPGPLHFTVDVSRSTGLPVRVNDQESASFDLSKLKRPGVTGTFSVNVTSVRSFSFG